jgi:hypothetical protein
MLLHYYENRFLPDLQKEIRKGRKEFSIVLPNSTYYRPLCEKVREVVPACEIEPCPCGLVFAMKWN